MFIETFNNIKIETRHFVFSHILNAAILFLCLFLYLDFIDAKLISTEEINNTNIFLSALFSFFMLSFLYLYIISNTLLYYRFYTTNKCLNLNIKDFIDHVKLLKESRLYMERSKKEIIISEYAYYFNLDKRKIFSMVFENSQ